MAGDQTTRIAWLKSSWVMGTRDIGDVLAEPKDPNALRLTDIRWNLLTDARVQEGEIPRLQNIDTIDHCSL